MILNDGLLVGWVGVRNPASPGVPGPPGVDGEAMSKPPNASLLLLGALGVWMVPRGMEGGGIAAVDREIALLEPAKPEMEPWW